LPARAPEELPPEFAPRVDEPPGIDRRELLKLTAASAALAGLGACMERPHERIMPRSEQAPEQVPGVPVEYATSMVLDGFATGHVVKAMDGRPVKVEGNPEHPASLGGTTAHGQASILELYDPDRARAALERGAPASRASLARLIASLPAQEGLWFLLYPQSSPLLVELIARVRQRHPSAQVATDTPLDRRAVYRGASMAFGGPLEAQYRFDRADVVVALDADFLAAMPNSVRWSRDFARRRRLSGAGGDPGRLHVAEPQPTPTGSLADHRLALHAGDMTALAAGLLAELARGGRAPDGLPPELVARLARLRPPAPAADWLRATVRDLARNPARGIVLAGERQPAETHALLHLVNHALGNLGETITFTEPALTEPLGPGLADLARAAAAGEVQTLVIAEANPLYSAPADLGLERALARIPLTIHASLHEDETSRACTWFLPLAHPLESWGDARAYDGTLSFIQPLIRPLFGGTPLPELLAMFAGDPDASGHALLRDRDRRARGAGRDLELAWEEDLRRGFALGSGFTARPPRLDVASVGAALVPALATAIDAAQARGRAEERIEIAFAASHAVYDGRLANVGWLQELPRPITKLTWGNAAQLAPALAARLGVGTGDVVRLQLGGRSLEAPALVVHGHADDAVTLELGGGRRAGGHVAVGVGADAGRLRTAAAPAFARGLRVIPTGARQALAITQGEMRAHGRELAPIATLAAYRADPGFTRAQRGGLPTLLPERAHTGPQWAMTIDTSICSGCSACVVACQAENNIPIVGRQGVLDHREMHWLRIDTYLTGSADRPTFVHQPMLCQHCEDAPCEYVCPVNATTHSPDGLNEMTYNRCIGTRFCSNNCPYKVRRFNWFDYTGAQPETVQLQRNPNVTVRERGVMEKCTYCVQRIRAVEIQTRIERRGLRPGEVVTACQQACPTGAIQFGALEHAGTPMVQWRREPRRYDVLHDLGTRPRTTYLARIVNPPDSD
jgi:Fe-S-cluster-containing dehydrogenase component